MYAMEAAAHITDLYDRWNDFMQVRYLKVIEKSGYQALPWVRYITCAGNYEIRFGS
jgi:hypothetical protein